MIGSDIVIECVGIEATAAQMVDIVRRGGRYVMAGIPSDKIKIDLLPLVFGEIETGQINVEASLDRVIPFSQAIDGLKESYESKETGKLIIFSTFIWESNYETFSGIAAFMM